MGNLIRPIYLSLRTMAVMEILHWAALLPWIWARLFPKVTDASVSDCNFRYIYCIGSNCFRIRVY